MDNNYYYNQQNWQQPQQNQQSQQQTQQNQQQQAQQTQYQQSAQQTQFQQSAHQQQKKGGRVFSKIMISACMGLLFGVFGGLGFFAVSKTTGMTNTRTQEVVGSVNSENTDSSSAQTNQSTTSTAVINAITSSDAERPVGDVTTIAEALMPAMVQVQKEYKYEYGNDIYSFYFGGGSNSTIAKASGSGFIIGETDTEYLIVSNNHVVADPVSLTVVFNDDSTASAYIKGTDATMDVAVIAVQKSDVDDATKNLIKIVSIGDSENVRLGEQVVAIGNALGYGQSVTTGIVSAIDREITMDDGSTGVFIQTDAAINPGNSGGALINMSGEVIGINSSKIGGSTVEGMGYAIPISSVTDLISDFMVQQTRIPIPEEDMGYMGISLQEVTKSLSERFSIPVGIYVVEVSKGSGAEAAGLQAGDIITKFDSEKIESYDDLQNIIKYYAKGTTVKITYERQENGEYQTYTTELTLGEKPTDVN